MHHNNTLSFLCHSNKFSDWLQSMYMTNNETICGVELALIYCDIME